MVHERAAGTACRATRPGRHGSHPHGQHFGRSPQCFPKKRGWRVVQVLPLAWQLIQAVRRERVERWACRHPKVRQAIEKPEPWECFSTGVWRRQGHLPHCVPSPPERESGDGVESFAVRACREGGSRPNLHLPRSWPSTPPRHRRPKGFARRLEPRSK